MKIKFEILSVLLITVFLIISLNTISFGATSMGPVYGMIMQTIYIKFDFNIEDRTEIQGNDRVMVGYKYNEKAWENFEKRKYIQSFIDGEISSGGINDLESFYNKYSSDKNSFLYGKQVIEYWSTQYGVEQPGDYAEPLYNKVMNLVKEILLEKERNEKFVEWNDMVNKIDTSKYSKEAINQLEEIYQKIDSEYGDNYYNNKIANLHGACINTTELNYDESVDLSQNLKNKIKNKVSSMQNSKGSISIKINTDDYNPNDDTTNYDTGIGIVKQKAGNVLGFIRNLSVVVSVITLMVIGVKYILGSVEEKAQYKQTLYPWLIGMFLVTGGTTLISFIYNFVK